MDERWIEATPTQQGIWILDRIERLRPTYLLPSVLEFRGPVRCDLLVDAVRRALGRHPALRSRFRLEPSRRRVEYTCAGGPGEVGLTDAVADGWTAAELARLVEVLCYAPFDLATEAPARAEVIRVDDEVTLLVLTVHHIVFDGVSRQLLVAEIADGYRAALAGTVPELPPAVHPAELVAPPAPDLAERTAATVERLRGAPTTVELPYDRDPEDDELSLVGSHTGTLLSPEVSRAVLRIAAEEGCTAFMAGVALLAAALARSGGQRDFLFGVVWPGRDDPATADAIGMFMTTLVLRIGLDERTGWRELLRRARATGLDAFIDADVPLHRLAAELDPDRDVTRPAVSPVLVNAAEPAPDVELAPGVRGVFRPLDPQYSKYDLALFVRADPAGRLELSLDHPAELFAPTTVVDLLAALRRAAHDLAHTPEDPVLDRPAVDDGTLQDPTARLTLVRSVWLEVLEVADVADDVSFFDAGGDSLRLVMLVERLSQASGRMLRTVDLFRAGTVRGQADLLAGPAAPAGPGGGARDRLLGSVRDRGERRLP